MTYPAYMVNPQLLYLSLIGTLFLCGINVPNSAYALSDVNSHDAVVHDKMNSTVMTGPEMKAIAISIGAVGAIVNGIVVLVLIHSEMLRQKTTNKSLINVATTKMEGITCMPYSEWGHMNEQSENALIALNLILPFGLPLVILVICYSRIVYFLYTVKLGAVDIRKERKTSVGIINMISTTSAVANIDTTLASLHINVNRPTKLSHVKVSTIRTLIIVAIGYIICWTPNEVYIILLAFGNACCTLSSPFYHVTVVLVFCNSIINPFIYAVQFRDFQIGLKQLFCCQK